MRIYSHVLLFSLYIIYIFTNKIFFCPEKKVVHCSQSTSPSQNQRISLGLLKFWLINSKPGGSSIFLGFANLLGWLQGCRESLRIPPGTAWDKVHGGRQVWHRRAPSGLIKSNCSSVYRTPSPTSFSFPETKVLLQRLARVPIQILPISINSSLSTNSS